MLTLLLVRHAKAVSPSGDDFTRLLTDKGHADAARLGTFLNDKSLFPDRVLVSRRSNWHRACRMEGSLRGRPRGLFTVSGVGGAGRCGTDATAFFPNPGSWPGPGDRDRHSHQYSEMSFN